MRALDLELAAYAESALAHWQILTDLLGTTIEGVAEAMERTAERMRHIGWIAPQRPCRDDYKTLAALYAKRGKKFGA